MQKTIYEKIYLNTPEQAQLYHFTLKVCKPQQHQQPRRIEKIIEDTSNGLYLKPVYESRSDYGYNENDYEVLFKGPADIENIIGAFYSLEKLMRVDLTAESTNGYYWFHRAEGSFILRKVKPDPVAENIKKLQDMLYRPQGGKKEIVIDQ